MKTFVKFDLNILTKKVLEDILNTFAVQYKIIGFGEIELLESVSDQKIIQITKLLNEYGIEIIENQKSILVQKIKDAITEMVNSEEPIAVKSSVYLADKINHSYGYLSNLFSEVTYTSIENYIIIQKIELAKHFIINDQMTLTEIAFKLNYSSVAHLSTQFKNITGITPSAFQRILKKRREINIKNL
jgi:AraC-like DNA-binding protein